MCKSQKYKRDNSVNTLMTQKSIFQFNQKHSSIVRNKNLKISTCFLYYMYRKYSEFALAELQI